MLEQSQYGEVLTTSFDRDCEPLTPDDIAEVIVFAAGRRENVVVADTLIFPNHQVCLYKIPRILSISESKGSTS